MVAVAVQLLSCVCLFCNPMDCSPPGSSVLGIFQARILEWVDISYSRGSSQPRDPTFLSCLCRQVLYHWSTRETHWDACYLTKVLLQYYLPGNYHPAQILKVIFFPLKKLKKFPSDAPVLGNLKPAGWCWEETIYRRGKTFPLLLQFYFFMYLWLGLLYVFMLYIDRAFSCCSQWGSL